MKGSSMLIGEGGLSSSLTERLRASWLLSTNMFKNVCGKPLKSDNYAHAQQQLKGQSKQKYLSFIIYSPSSCSKPYFPLCNIKEEILKYVCNPIFWIPTFFFYVSSTEERKQYTFGMIWEWINDHFRVTIPLICFFCSTHLQPRGRVETFNYLGVIKKTIGSITDGHHTSATAVDVNAVHVTEGQTDVSGWLRQDGEALVRRIGPLGEAQHRHCG